MNNIEERPIEQFVIGRFYDKQSDTTLRVADAFAESGVNVYPNPNAAPIEIIDRTGTEIFFDRSGRGHPQTPRLTQQKVFDGLREMAQDPEKVAVVAVHEGYLGKSTAVELMLIISQKGKACLTDETSIISDEIPQEQKEFIMRHVVHYPIRSVEEIERNGIQDLREQKGYEPKISETEKDMVEGAIDNLLRSLDEKFLLTYVPTEAVGFPTERPLPVYTLINSYITANHTWSGQALIALGTQFPRYEGFNVQMLERQTRINEENTKGQKRILKRVVDRYRVLSKQKEEEAASFDGIFEEFISPSILVAIENGVFFDTHNDESTWACVIPGVINQEMIDGKSLSNNAEAYRINSDTGEKTAVSIEEVPVFSEKSSVSSNDHPLVPLSREVGLFYDPITNKTFILVSKAIPLPPEDVQVAIEKFGRPENFSQIMKERLTRQEILNQQGYYFINFNHKGREAIAILKFEDQNPEKYINPDFSRYEQVLMMSQEGFSLVKDERINIMRQQLTSEGVEFSSPEREVTVPAINSYTLPTIASEIGITDSTLRIEFEDAVNRMRNYLEGRMIKDPFGSEEEDHMQRWIHSHLRPEDGAFFHIVYEAQNQINVDTIQETLRSIEDLYAILYQVDLQEGLLNTIEAHIISVEEEFLEKRRDFAIMSDEEKKEFVRRFENSIITILQLLPEVAKEQISIT